MKFSPITLPFQIELILSLISEDVKKRKFFNGLHSLELRPNRWFESDFGRLVLKSVGFQVITDELQEFYSELIHKHSDPTVSLEEEEIDEVYRVYSLLIKKRREMCDH